LGNNNSALLAAQFANASPGS